MRIMKHGGKRKGAGRKAPHGKTKVIRVPVVLIPEIEKMKERIKR